MWCHRSFSRPYAETPGALLFRRPAPRDKPLDLYLPPVVIRHK
jgi:hypothetical protein